MNDNSSSGLFGKTRQAVLTLLYLRPDLSFYTKQIIDAAKTGRGAVQRELENLTGSGIITREVRGRQVYYRANENCPFFKDLSSMMKTTDAMPRAARETKVAYEPDETQKAAQRPSAPKRAIAAFCRRNHIRRLSLFGSVLRKDFRPDSDIDVLVEFDPDHFPGYFKMFDMEEELSVLFGGRKIDLRTPEDLSRYFRDSVLNEAKELYAAT